MCDPRAIQHINFTVNLDRAGGTRIFFILEEAKERKKAKSWTFHKEL